MFTLKLFDGLVSPRRNTPKERDLQTWARIEFKNDADFAYNYMLENGTAPIVGANQ